MINSAQYIKEKPYHPDRAFLYKVLCNQLLLITMLPAIFVLIYRDILSLYFLILMSYAGWI